MNIHFNTLSSYSASYLKERIQPTLTEQQKKIAPIVSIVLGFLAACYLITRCWISKPWTDKEEPKNLPLQDQDPLFQSQPEIKEEERKQASSEDSSSTQEVNLWPKEVYATNKKCITFLEEIQKTPERGVAIQKLALCSDRFNDVSKPSGYLTDNDLKTIVKLCPNITHLDLYRCLSLTDKGLKKIGKLAHLKFLSLSCCTGASDNFMLSLKEKPLIKLNLHNCFKITTIGFAVLPTLKELKVLSLENCRQLKDTDLERFSDLKLKALHILGCKKISDKGLQVILKMQNLENCCGAESISSLPKTSSIMRNKIKSSLREDRSEFDCIKWNPADHEDLIENS